MAVGRSHGVTAVLTPALFVGLVALSGSAAREVVEAAPAVAASVPVEEPAGGSRNICVVRAVVDDDDAEPEMVFHTNTEPVDIMTDE